MTPDGEAGEPAYVISDTAVESEYILFKSLSLKFGKLSMPL